MKSAARFATLGAFAALLCFAPSAFGQGLVGGTARGLGVSALHGAPSAFLVFAGGHDGNQNGRDHFGGDSNHDGDGNGNGCGNQGWDDSRWDGGGWGSGGGCGGNGGGKTVPEGGTSLMYLAVSGLFCLGAVVYRSRRQASLRETQ